MHLMKEEVNSNKDVKSSNDSSDIALDNGNNVQSPETSQEVKVAGDVDNKHVSSKCDSIRSSDSIDSSSSQNSLNERNGGSKRTKDIRNGDHLKKEIGKIDHLEEKLSFAISKYEDLSSDFITMQTSSRKNEKRLKMLQKEKESLQSDYNKAVLTRSRLEDLCRELQRHNKTVKEESLSKVREEEEKRKEESAKFQTALNEISVMLQDNQSQSSKLQKENMEMAKKLKVLFDQYHLREKHVEKLIQHREIETKLSETKIAKMQAVVAEEKENNMLDKKRLLEEVMALQKKCTELATNELKAKLELKSYKDKYEEFQDNLQKSNLVFENFKTEMNKMSKKIQKLEKETLEWQSKWKSSNKVLISMVEDKQKSDQQLHQSQEKVNKLESLCRALQKERNELRSNTDEKNGSAEDDLNLVQPLADTTSKPACNEDTDFSSSQAT